MRAPAIGLAAALALVAYAAILAFAPAASATAALGEHQLPADGSFTLRFDEPGEVAYHCHPHPKMKAILRVVAGEPAVNATVRTVDLAFDPADLTVGPGSNVTWVNEDGVFHTVTRTSEEAHGHAIPAAGALLAAALAAGAALAARRR